MVKKKRRYTSKFKQKVAANSHKQKIQATQYGYLRLPRNVSVFKEEPGSRVRLDILPYVVTDENHPDRDDENGIALPGELWYKRPYKLHRGVGVENTSVVCPTSFGKPCPICEYRARLIKEGGDKATIAALKPSLRNLYIVVPKDSKAYEEKPHIWDISQFLFQNQLNEEIEENDDYAVFPDLEEGLTLRIRFSEETFRKNKFASTSRIDFEERDEPYDEGILKQTPNLDEVLDVLPYSKIEAIFFGTEISEYEDEEDDVAEDEEDDEPIRKRKIKSIREEPEFRRLMKEEEDEEEEEGVDEEGEEDSDDNDEVSSSDDDELVEDINDDDDPEEVEENPRKTKRTRTKKDNRLSNKCPYGHEFGTDCEEYDDCDECDMWEDCIEEKEANA